MAWIMDRVTQDFLLDGEEHQKRVYQMMCTTLGQGKFHMDLLLD
jgi:hypothetical protein